MRNKSTRIQNVRNIARLGILAICFVLAFSIALTSDIFDGTATEYFDNVAIAADDLEGGLGTITPDQGVLTAATLGFPGTDASKRTWTSVSQTFANTTFSNANVSGYHNSKSSTEILIDQGVGQFTVRENEQHGTYNPDTYSVVNFNMPSFISKIVQNTNITVTATCYATLNRTHATPLGSYAVNGVKAIASSKSLAANDALVVGKDSYSKQNGNGEKNYTVSATLTAANPRLALSFVTEAPIQCTVNYVVSNISVVYTITLSTAADTSTTSIGDGAGPKLANYNLNNTYPYRPDNTQNGTDWLYYPTSDSYTSGLVGDVLSKYTSAKDVVADGSTSAKLHSYVRTSQSNGPAGFSNYYKKISITYVDYYNYAYGATGSTATVGDSVTPYFTSGIKSIRVGESTINVYDIANNGGTSSAAGFKIEATDTEDSGCFTVTKDNRGRVTVVVYFMKNAIANVQATDFGGMTSPNVKVDVRGIDTTDVDGTVTLDTASGFTSTTLGTGNSWDGLKWYNESTFLVDLTENFDGSDVEEEGSSPYVWFYSVKKVNNPNDTLTSANWDLATLLQKVPFAVGNVDRFTYDFKTGYASPGYDTNGVVNKGVLCDANATGAGYYLFTFYAMDLATNYKAANSISYYVRADYEQPVYTLDKSFGGVSIDQNTGWAAGSPLKVTLTQSVVSISGNTLIFADYDATDHFVSVLNGKIVSVDKTAVTPANTVSIGSAADGTTVNVGYTISGANAIWTLTFCDAPISGQTKYFDFNYVTTFPVCIGTDPDTDTLVEYVDKGAEIGTTAGGAKYYKWQYTTNNGTSYVNGVYVRCDRNAPEAPVLEDTAEAAENGTGVLMPSSSSEYNTIPDVAGRSWYTSSWSYNALLAFNESLLQTFGKEIKVFIGVKAIASAADFTAAGSKAHSVSDFVNAYESGYGNYNDYNFTNVIERTGDSLTDITAVSLDLIQAQGAGMRQFFMWAVDQAGNRSELGMCYLLVDANNYFYRGFIDNTKFGDQAGTITTGNVRTMYKRGASIEFNYELSDGYVAYKLEYRVSETPSVIWTTTDPLSPSQSYTDGYVTLNGTDFVILADQQNLGALPSNNNDIFVYFNYRKVVNFTVTNTNVRYSGTPTDVPMWLSEEDARNEVTYSFKNDAAEDISTPSDIGRYTVSIVFDSADYVSQKVDDLAYSITQAPVTITVNTSTGEFGEAQTLGYTVSGLVGDDLAAWNAGSYTFATDRGLTLPNPANSLVISDATPEQIANAYKTLGVGTHRISRTDGADFSLTKALEGGATVNNYAVTFIDANHVVTQNYIEIRVLSSTKFFGDADGTFSFFVSYEDASNHRNIPEGYDQTNITQIFTNASVVSSNADGITLKGLNDAKLIVRVAGEDVGNYEYTTYTGNFTMMENYAVVILQSTTALTVNPRRITVTPASNQEFLANAENKYEFNYSVPSVDARFLDLLEGGFTIGNQYGSTITSDPNFDVTQYYLTGVGGTNQLTSANNNVVFTLANTTTTFKIKTLKDLPQDQVITLSLKPNMTVVKTYGEAWDSEAIYPTTYGGTYFDCSYALPTGFTIRWTATLSGSVDAYGFYPVGNYTMRSEDVKVYDASGDVQTGYIIEVDNVLVTYNPAKISVIPTVSKSDRTKAYGNLDSEYGLGFANSNVDAKFNSAISGVTFNGAFVRAIFNAADHSFVRLAGQYDTATNANGTFTENGKTYYYGIRVSTAFTSNNANFVPDVDPIALKNEKLYISPVAITLSGNDFTGKSKSYDGNTMVKYNVGEKEAVVDISSQLKIGTDIVYVDFDANYDTPDRGLEKTITFSNLTLKGDQAVNYYLAVTGSFVIDRIVPGSEEKIQITGAQFSLYRSDFIVSKEYDATNRLDLSCISIATDCALYGSAFTLENQVSFDGVNVNMGNFKTRIILFFAGINSTDLEYLPEDSDSAITVAYVSSPTSGMRVTIDDLSGSITPKVIKVTDLQNLIPIDRRYNGSTAVNVEYTLKDGVICAGDTIDDVGLTFDAFAFKTIAGSITPTADAGTQGVRFNNLPTVTASGNYISGFTAEELNAYFDTITVKIEKARVEINVAFNPDKQYEGNAATNQTLNKANDGVAGGDVSNYGSDVEFVLFKDDEEGFDSTAMMNELAYFNYNWNEVSFSYTINGALDAGVAVDANGNVILHNVKVSGLKLIAKAGSTDAETQAVLKNYEILAFVWDSEKNEYVSANRVAAVASTIEEYEMLAAAPLDKKTLTPSLNGIRVSDKMYDGTKTAPVTLADITSIGVAASEAAYLELTFVSEFDSKDVGTDKTVSITIDRLINTSAAGSVDYAKNYRINNKMPCTARKNVTPAPIAASISVGSKVYDGNNTIDQTKISTQFIGLVSAETDNYAIGVTTASYDGVNVADTDSATIYGVKLVKTTTNKIINYNLVYASRVNGATEISYVDDETRDLTKLGNLPASDDNGNIYYYALPTIDVYILENTQYRNLIAGMGAGAPAVFGTYMSNGSLYYVVDGSAVISGYTAQSITRFDNATGTITPKPVSVSVTAVNPDAFAKPYDGTDIFGGTQADYSISGTTGFVGEDGKYITLDASKIAAKYQKASAGSTHVEFTFQAGALIANVRNAYVALTADEKDPSHASHYTGTRYNISGDGSTESPYQYEEALDGNFKLVEAYLDVYKNYSSDASSAIVSANISKLQITATLADTSFVYGSAPASYSDKVSYKVSDGTNDYTLSISEGYAYLSEADYRVMFNKFLGTFATNEAKEAAMLGKLYEVIDGVYTKVTARENEKTYMVRIGGTFTAPSVVAGVTSATIVKEGGYPYTLKGGSSTNYVFIANYSQPGATSSTITIEKATLKVSAANVTAGTDYFYSKYYGDANPVIKFNYTGFVGSDGVSAITTAPVANFRLYTYDANTAKYVAGSAEIPTNALITSDLEHTEYYAVYFESAGTAANYNIVVDTDTVAKLNLTIAPFTGITFGNKTVAYDGTVKSGVITAVNAPANTQVQYAYYKGVGDSKTAIAATAVKNAGEYTIVATVTRPCTGNNVNGTSYNQSGVYTAVLTVTKVSFTMVSSAGGKAYDKKVYDVDILDVIRLSGVAEADVEYVLRAFSMEIMMKNADGDYEWASEMRDAGDYRLDFSFAPATTGVTSNYNALTYSAACTISPAEIIVTVADDVKRQIYDEENGNVISYTYDFSAAAKALGFSASDVKESRFDIGYQIRTGKNPDRYQKESVMLEEGMGSFPYLITYSDTNFKLTGDYKGTLVVGGKIITTITEEGATPLASATLNEGMIYSTTTSIEYINVKKSNNEYSNYEELNSYWKTINKYMPAFADESHMSELAGVVRLKMLNGTAVVQPSSSVQMRVKIPNKLSVEPAKGDMGNTTKVEVYYVNKDGGLSKLNYTADGSYIVYDTDYVSSLVFVKVSGINMILDLPYWIWGIIGGGAIVLIAVIVTVSVLAAKKKKARKNAELVPEAAGDGSLPIEDEAAPEEDGALKAMPYEEETAMKAIPYEEETALKAIPYEEPAPMLAPEPTPEPVSAPAPAPEPVPEPAPAPAPEKVRPSAPTHIGKKKPPVIGLKDAEKLNERSVSAASDVEPTPAAPAAAPEAKAPEAVHDNGAVPPVVGKKEPPVIGKKEPPVIGKKEPPVVGKKEPPVIGKKPPVIGKKPDSEM